MKTILLILSLLLPLAASAQFTIPQRTGATAASSGGGRVITYTGANCVNSTATTSASCTLAASGAVGDLLIVLSKTATTSNTTTAAMTFTGTASCASPTQVIAPGVANFQSNGTGGHYIVALFACLITTAGAETPTVTWTGGGGSFSDIAVGTYHTTTSWKSTFVDQTATNVATTSTTSCPTGTTAATTNAGDLILATCNNFDFAETWGTLSGFTNRASSSRNTTAWYDKTVSTTGTQTATVPLSAADVGVGMIAAFSSN